MDDLTKDVIAHINEIKERTKDNPYCTEEDLEVLFLASLLEEKEQNGWNRT